MKQSKNKWEWCGKDDEDPTTKRVFDASRMTLARLDVIRGYVSRHNREWHAPYGVSPNGYPYNCGCEHDCCGCIIRNRMTIEYASKQVIIFHSVSRNY